MRERWQGSPAPRLGGQDKNCAIENLCNAVNQRVTAGFTDSRRRTGEDGPKTIYLEPMADGAIQRARAAGFLVFRISHSTMLRSHSTF
jgi:hypothetical protein